MYTAVSILVLTCIAVNHTLGYLLVSAVDVLVFSQCLDEELEVLIVRVQLLFPFRHEFLLDQLEVLLQNRQSLSLFSNQLLFLFNLLPELLWALVHLGVVFSSLRLLNALSDFFARLLNLTFDVPVIIALSNELG